MSSLPNRNGSDGSVFFTQTVQLVPVVLPVVGLRPVTLGKMYMPSYGAGCTWFQLCMPS